MSSLRKRKPEESLPPAQVKRKKDEVEDLKESVSSDNESEQSSPEEALDNSVAEPAKQWTDFALDQRILDAVIQLKWKQPTEIQRESLPFALEGRDIIALAETGSGKTGAFALPILQSLLTDLTPYYALVLSPTRYVPTLSTCLCDAHLYVNQKESWPSKLHRHLMLSVLRSV